MNGAATMSFFVPLDPGDVISQETADRWVGSSIRVRTGDGRPVDATVSTVRVDDERHGVEITVTPP